MKITTHQFLAETLLRKMREDVVGVYQKKEGVVIFKRTLDLSTLLPFSTVRYRQSTVKEDNLGKHHARTVLYRQLTDNLGNVYWPLDERKTQLLVQKQEFIKFIMRHSPIKH